MKIIKITVRFIIELLLLGVLILAIVVVINNFIPRQQPVSKLPEQITSNPYPPPDGTNPAPSPIIEETQIAPVPTLTITPYPSLMPFPTATLKPGPEPTPIPLSPPAKDAAGSILFLSRESNTVKSALNSLNVDLNGIPKSEVSQLSTYEITENFAYPSPDGQNIIFTIDTEGGPVGTILDLKSGKLEPLLHGLHIRAFFNWYPDSKHILVQLDGNDLWLFEINSDQGTPLAQPRLGAIVGAAASPDGKQVIYSHSMGNSLPSELWIVNADGRDAIKLFDIGYEAISFSWSPDGKKIAFFGDGLMLMNSDGTQLYSVSHHPMHIGVEIPAIWSPDSRFLAIDTLQSPSPNSILYDKSNIYLIDAETGVERPLLADGISGNLDPTWSPDGSKVAFVSNRSGATEVWEVNVDGKDLLQLTHNGKIVRFPHWYN